MRVARAINRRFRYGSMRDDFDGGAENHHPYTIVIQLPKEEDKYDDDNYEKRKRNYERISIPVYTIENDYIEDEDDIESKVVNVNNKKMQIKVKMRIYVLCYVYELNVPSRNT